MFSIETSASIIAVCLMIQTGFTIYYGVKAMQEEADRQRQIITFIRKTLNDHLNMATKDLEVRVDEILRASFLRFPGLYGRKN